MFADDQTVAALEDVHQLVEAPALFGSLSRGGRLDEIVDAESVFACVLEDGEALAAHVLMRGRDPQIGNGFHGLTMGCVTVHATELLCHNERLFLTEPCRSPIRRLSPPSDSRCPLSRNRPTRHRPGDGAHGRRHLLAPEADLPETADLTAGGPGAVGAVNRRIQITTSLLASSLGAPDACPPSFSQKTTIFLQILPILVATESVEKANLWRAEGGLRLQLRLLVPLQQPHLRHAAGGAGPRDAGSGIDAGSVPVLSGELTGVILTSLKGTATRLREDMKQLSERVAWVEHSQAKLEGLLEGLREAITVRATGS